MSFQRNVAEEIADVFNHVYQRHNPSEVVDVVLCDAAREIAQILNDAGYCSRKSFLEIASRSGLPCEDTTNES